MTVRFKTQISFHGMEDLLQKERGWSPAPPFVIYSLQEDTKQRCLPETYNKRQQNEAVAVQLKSKLPLNLFIILNKYPKCELCPGCSAPLCSGCVTAEQRELQEPGASWEDGHVNAETNPEMWSAAALISEWFSMLISPATIKLKWLTLTLYCRKLLV